MAHVRDVRHDDERLARPPTPGEQPAEVQLKRAAVGGTFGRI